MTPTRRNPLKIAAGLGLTGIVPTPAQRIAAAESLTQPVSDTTALDPATFADEAQNLIGYSSTFVNDWLGAINPKPEVAYHQAREAFIALMPELQDRPVNFDDPRAQLLRCRGEARRGLRAPAAHRGR